jgi:hypothetical protein
MLFKYKITLDVEVEFDAPLLGTDTTKNKRKQVDSIAKKALQEMINFKTTSYVGVNREINDENLKGNYKGEIILRSAKMFEEDKKK